MNRKLVLFLSGVLIGTLAASRALTAEPPRAVIELFTSQGCAACPPADKILTTYAQGDKSVIALTYPVTIWDHLGWRDTLALPENTARQRGYAATRGDGKVYTPQAVVDGVFHSVGSDRNDIESKCAERAGNVSEALSVPIQAQSRDGMLDIAVPTWPGQGEPPRARLFLVSYAKERNVPITKGENAGTSATYTNVVRSLHEIAYWNGSPLKLRLFWRPASSEGGALLLQSMSRDGPGVIYGAARISEN